VHPTPDLDVGWHCVLDADGAVKAGGAAVAIYRLAVARAGSGSGTVGGSGAAIQCGRFCIDRLDASTLVTLTAVPARGSRFLRWNGACHGSRPACVVRMTGPISAVAVFAKTGP
jgi:hypothetical protein